MGRSKVTTRWSAITICILVGNAISDMIATWIELRCVDGGETERWRSSRAGVTVGVLNTLCKLAWEFQRQHGLDY